ncbi:MAG: CDP-alcohol phosphatidyltransferase family protein [Nitrososphaerota archaeon]|nr:CDP-alcohol phosphatidyltransferase family protein [Nitrososphaerota archaeon]
MLDKLRDRISGFTLGLGRGAAQVMPSPTAWTVVGVMFSVLAAAFFATGGYRGELGGGISVLVSGFLDVVDGAVARATGRISRRGAFLDSTLDRLGETSIYLGVLLGNYTSPVIVFVALSCSLLVSYSRAKADSLSVNLAGVGIGERSERLVVLVVASLVGLLAYGVLLVAALAAVTFATRVARVTATLKENVATRAPAGEAAPVSS